MNEPTSDVLVERARLEPGARHNLAWSVLGHVVDRRRHRRLAARAELEPAMRQVMTISLSGSPGPNDGRA